MRTLFSLICLSLTLLPCTLWAEAEKRPVEKPETSVMATIQKIAKGTTVKEREAENVSLSIAPTKASISISF